MVRECVLAGEVSFGKLKKTIFMTVRHLFLVVQASMQGSVFMGFNMIAGTRTVVHPTAQILAEKGPIIIGEGNLIEEKVKIVNK